MFSVWWCGYCCSFRCWVIGCVGWVALSLPVLWRRPAPSGRRRLSLAVETPPQTAVCCPPAAALSLAAPFVAFAPPACVHFGFFRGVVPRSLALSPCFPPPVACLLREADVLRAFATPQRCASIIPWGR